MLLFGPWRQAVRRLIGIIRPPKFQNAEREVKSFAFHLDETAICEETRKNSVASVGMISDILLRDIRSVTDNLPVDQYQEIHAVDQNIRRFVDDPALKNLVRRYFQAEPVMLECTLMITCNEKGALENMPAQYHFDYATWDFVNIFVYLTDVLDESGYHEVIEASHGKKTFSDLIYQPEISIEEALRRFDSGFRPLKGRAGSIYMENTEAFHRRKPSSEKRVMLNMLYASCPDIFCRGRTYPANIHKRDKQYALLFPDFSVNEMDLVDKT